MNPEPSEKQKVKSFVISSHYLKWTVSNGFSCEEWLDVRAYINAQCMFLMQSVTSVIQLLQHSVTSVIQLFQSFSYFSHSVTSDTWMNTSSIKQTKRMGFEPMSFGWLSVGSMQCNIDVHWLSWIKLNNVM